MFTYIYSFGHIKAYQSASKGGAIRNYIGTSDASDAYKSASMGCNLFFIINYSFLTSFCLFKFKFHFCLMMAKKNKIKE